jgi:hypothetical protein
MINQPFGGKPKWFTYQPAETVQWNPENDPDKAPRWQAPNSTSTLTVEYQSFEKILLEETIDLRNVTGWETLSPETRTHKFGLEILRVFVNEGNRRAIILYNQKGNLEVKLAKWDSAKRARGIMQEVTIPQPELKQIDDFFDAMLAANLL